MRVEDEEPVALGGVPLHAVEACARRLREEALVESNLVRGKTARRENGCAPATLGNLLSGVLAEAYGLDSRSSSGGRGEPLLPERAPIAIKLVPTLAAVADLQLRLTTKVMCAVAARPIVTVFELEREICAEEEVATFAELGFGHGLQCLPIAQQYFQVSAGMRVAPITAQHVLEYLLTSQEAGAPTTSPAAGLVQTVAGLPTDTTCRGDTDTRTLLNGFRVYYETLLRPHMGGSRDGPDVEDAPRRLSSNRELGIHIQSLSWLMNALRQESAARAASVVAAVDSASTTFRRNKQLYQAVVRSLDQKLLASTAPGSFVVTMPEAAAASTSVPLSLWASAPGPAGGVELHLHMGSTPAAPALLRTEPPVQVHGRGTESAPVCEPPIPPSSPPAAVKRRRGGGAVIRDESTPCVPSTTVDAAPSPLSQAPSVSSRIVPPLEAGSRSVADTGGAVGGAPGKVQTAASNLKEDTTHELVMEESPLEVMHAYVSQATGTLVEAASSCGARGAVDVVRRALSRLIVGQVVSGELLKATFERIGSTLCEDAAVLARFMSEVAGVAFLPITHPLRRSTGGAASVSQNTVEIVTLASLEDIYWPSSFTNAMSSAPMEVQSAVQRFFHAGAGSLSYLSDAFVSAMRQRMSGTIHCISRPWMLSVAVNRRVYPLASSGSESDASFTAGFLHAFSFYFEAAFAEELRNQESCGVGYPDAVVAAAERLAPGAGAELTTALAFPLHGAWRSGGLDGLFYAGPRDFGFADLHLRPDTAGTPELPVLPFSASAPSYVVAAALTLFGVRALDRCIVRHVSFESLRPGESSLLLHRAVVAVTPYVQSFLAAHDHATYALAYALLRNRLCHLRVTLGCGARLRERLSASVSARRCTYTSVRGVRLTYVAAHHTLYGEDGDFSPAVVADALVDLFLPLLPVLARREDVAEGVRALLTHLLRVFAGFTETTRAGGDGLRMGSDGGYTSEALLTGADPAVAAALATALDAEARRFSRARGLDPPVCSSVDALNIAGEGVPLPGYARVPLTVAAVPTPRPQIFFPPGVDGLGQPPAREPFRRAQGSCREGGEGFPRGGVLSGSGEGGGHGLSAAALERAARVLPVWRNTWASEEASSALDSALACLAAASAGGLESDSEHTGDRPVARRRVETAGPAPRSLTERAGGVDDEESDDEESMLSFQARRRRAAAPAAGVFLSNPLPALVRTDGSTAGDGGSAAAIAAERFVYEALKAEYAAAHGGNFVVLWMNEHGERGTPYDVIVLRRVSRVPGANDNRRPYTEGGRRAGRTTDEPEVVAYVEVKSTTSSDRRDFELSIRELLLAARYGAAYKVYRVFGASTSPMRRMRYQVYEDLVSLWYTGKMTITGNIRASPAH